MYKEREIEGCKTRRHGNGYNLKEGKNLPRLIRPSPRCCEVTPRPKGAGFGVYDGTEWRNVVT